MCYTINVGILLHCEGMDMTITAATSRKFNQKAKENIIDLLAMPNAADIDFEAVKLIKKD